MKVDLSMNKENRDFKRYMDICLDYKKNRMLPIIGAVEVYMQSMNNPWKERLRQRKLVQKNKQSLLSLRRKSNQNNIPIYYGKLRNSRKSIMKIEGKQNISMTDEDPNRSSSDLYQNQENNINPEIHVVVKEGKQKNK